jgi:hypothetical protein
VLEEADDVGEDEQPEQGSGEESVSNTNISTQLAAAKY